MKYAIFESGGKQYKAAEGTLVDVDRLPLEVGASLELDGILLFADDGTVSVGNPTVKGAKVKATVAGQIKAPKVIVFKYREGNRYRRKAGHRQRYTRLQIDQIVSK